MSPRALLSLAIAVALAILVLGAREAHAGKTWCTSAFYPGPGYANRAPGPMTEGDPCADSCFKGSSWHFHGFVTKDGKCYSCWDESDNTCQDVAKDYGYAWASDSQCDVSQVGDWDDAEAGCYPEPKQPDPATSQPDPAAQADPSGAQTPAPVADTAPAVVRKPMPRPPKPKPTDYEGTIVKISPGPYAVNTPITVVGGAQTAVDKKARRVSSGDFVVVDAQGKELARIHGKAKGRNVVAQVSIPSGTGGKVTIRFEPKYIITASSEKLASVTPGEQTIDVEACRVQAVLDAPAAGEILVADATAQLRGHVLKNGAPATGADLAGAKAIFVVEIAGDEQRVDATIDASGAATASQLIKKPQADVEAVHVRLIAEGGQGDVCPSAEVEAKTTALGVSIDLAPDPGADGKPRQCYVDRPCPVTARFRLPADPTARTVGEAFIRSAGLTMTAAAGGPSSPLTTDRPGAVDAVWKGVITPGDTGIIPLAGIAKSPTGEVADQALIDVIEPIELKLDPVLELGVVRAGSPSNQRCVELSFKASRGARYQRFRLTATRPKGCDSYPVVYDARSGVGYAMHQQGKPVELEIGDALTVPICLAAVPRCASESPPPAILTVAALSPDFLDQKQDVEVRWKVSGRSFLACWWWLVLAIGGTALVTFVGYGFIRPWRFAVDDQVQLAGKREQLARAVGRRLRDLPGGRTGWYRSGAVGLLDNGQATAKVGSALVELHAKRGEVIIRSRGGLERVSPQTKKLVPVPEAATRDGHVASKNVVYSAGSLFFQIK